jgi:hypothetical protein
VSGGSLTLFCVILLLPPFVEPAAYVLSENLAEAMLVAGFVSFALWALNGGSILIVAAGLAIGWAALTRPTFQLLAPTMAASLAMAKLLLPGLPASWRDVARAGAGLVAATLLLVVGYSYVNYRNVGYFGLSAKFGLTLSTKTARVLERLPDEYGPVKEILIRARDAEMVSSSEHTPVDYIWRAVPSLAAVTGFDDVHLSDYMVRINLILIKKAPLTYLQEVVWAFGSYWMPSSSEIANFHSRRLQALWAMVHFCLISAWAVNLILLVGAVTYIRRSLVAARPHFRLSVEAARVISSQGLTYAVAGVVVGYTAAISCVIQIGLARYRVPTDGLIVFMLFTGLALWSNLVGSARGVVYQPHGRFLSDEVEAQVLFRL